MIVFSLPIFGSSLTGRGGSSFGDSGFFSGTSPSFVCSCAFLSLSLSLTPPSVPVVPSLGASRFGSSMTVSCASISNLCCSFSFADAPAVSNKSSLSFFVLAFFSGTRSSTVCGFFFVELESMKGPACGMPSSPSTGAAFVPTSFGVDNDAWIDATGGSPAFAGSSASWATDPVLPLLESTATDAAS